MTKPPCMVWLPADHRQLGEDGARLPFLVLGDKYARVVKYGVQAQPVIFGLAQASDIASLLPLVDGVMLTGSPSNVHPTHFDQEVTDSSLPLDPERDGLTLALVQACIEQQVPLLGVCRGFQEINVALGGSLAQQVHEVAGRLDHREPDGVALEQQYAPAHEVRFAAGSAFVQWAGGPVARVNSLHGQGIDRLAAGLEPQGWAPDGLVEAFRVREARAFACAVQWHPEWRFSENPFYSAIFKAFGDACRQRQATRSAQA